MQSCGLGVHPDGLPRGVGGEYADRQRAENRLLLAQSLFENSVGRVQLEVDRRGALLQRPVALLEPLAGFDEGAEALVQVGRGGGGGAHFIFP